MGDNWFDPLWRWLKRISFSLFLLFVSMATTAAKEAAPPREVQVNVTGFGPFQGVADNPTSDLVRLLPARLGPALSGTSVRLDSCAVIETSAVGALTALSHDLPLHHHREDGGLMVRGLALLPVVMLMATRV